MSGTNGTGREAAEARPARRDLLAEIMAAERERLTSARAATPEAELRARAGERRRQSFAAALRKGAGAGVPAVIAEMKRASPSRGELRPGLDAGATAAAYAAAGATALSVLTEGPHFHGRRRDLAAARDACALPILRKDFIFDEYQIWEAAADGADAVLLIVAALPPDGVDADGAGAGDDPLRRLLAASERAGLEALTEVHDREELRRAAAAGARIIGVNNRDLRTFRVDQELASRLAGEIPAAVTAVAESGFRGAEDLRRAAAAGYHAVLIGEAFMTAADPGRALADLLAAARAGAEKNARR